MYWLMMMSVFHGELNPIHASALPHGLAETPEIARFDKTRADFSASTACEQPAVELACPRNISIAEAAQTPAPQNPAFNRNSNPGGGLRLIKQGIV
jgi:hypothetical protein